MIWRRAIFRPLRFVVFGDLVGNVSGLVPSADQPAVIDHHSYIISLLVSDIFLHPTSYLFRAVFLIILYLLPQRATVEVDQLTESTCLLEADRATRSTHLWACTSSVRCTSVFHFIMSVSSCHPKTIIIN